jgi:AraC-like DNA-binding protein
MDKISSLVGRYSFKAQVFFNGAFCNSNEFEQNGLAGHLHLVRSGPVVFSGPDTGVVRVDEPSMVFYPRGHRHRLEVPAGHTAQLLCATISFHAGGSNPLARVLPDCMVLPLRAVGTIRQTLYLMFAEANEMPQGREVILDRLCDVLIIQVIRHQFDSGALPVGLLAGLADRQLALALEAMHERPREPWQLDSLARLACMSRSRFTEHFRNLVGMPPMEYLARWRIGLAQSLLRKGAPVKIASAEAGYASPAAFTRAFGSVVGVSPRQWLRGLAPEPAGGAASGAAGKGIT